MITTAHKQFKRAVLFSGGGTRYGIYLGMYAALQDLKLTPDLIVATCGGSIAATIISALPTPREQKEYLQSEELYQFVKQTQLTKQKSLLKIGLFSLKKTSQSKSAPFIEDVFQRYLVELSQDLVELPSLQGVSFENSNTIIIGSRLLFSKKDILKKRGESKLYQKVVFSNKAILNSAIDADFNINNPNYLDSAVAASVEMKSDFSMTEAMRVSVSDMFYVEPFYKNSDIYAGGVIDLVPVEIANYFADELIVEKKQRYKPVEEALVRSVLGFSGNARLDEIAQFPVKYWIDTRDASAVLRKHCLQKEIDWKQLAIKLKRPITYTQFQHDMEMQWNYGYQQTLKSISI